MLLEIDRFLSLRKELPVVDVRSEGEFQSGHIRHASNIPILNNAERAAVGTDYKQKGQREAIKTGFRLVGPRLSSIIEEAERVANGGEILVHCWRGGMRSSNFCQFLEMARIKAHQLTGGYKAYRQRAVESFGLPFQFIVVGGCTGSGKSEVIRALAARGEQVLDLEALAHHKGSAFGALLQPPQPTTEQFQNELFEEILKLDVSRRVWVEDESIAIGKIFLPNDLWQTMLSSPVVEIVVSKEVRIQRLVGEYGPADRGEFLSCMERITKKLGGQNFQAAKEKLQQGDMPAVMDLLLTYYDKAYMEGLRKKQNRIAARKTWNGSGIEHFAEALSVLEVPPIAIQEKSK